METGRPGRHEKTEKEVKRGRELVSGKAHMIGNYNAEYVVTD